MWQSTCAVGAAASLLVPTQQPTLHIVSLGDELTPRPDHLDGRVVSRTKMASARGARARGVSLGEMPGRGAAWVRTEECLARVAWVMGAGRGLSKRLRYYDIAVLRVLNAQNRFRGSGTV